MTTQGRQPQPRACGSARDVQELVEGLVLALAVGLGHQLAEFVIVNVLGSHQSLTALSRDGVAPRQLPQNLRIERIALRQQTVGNLENGVLIAPFSGFEGREL